MNILFAVNRSSDNSIEQRILSHYKNTFQEDFNYKKEYYLQGVFDSLNQEHFDILILNELLENEPVNTNFIDLITDTFNDVRIILIVENEHKGDKLIKTLFAYGCYDCLFKMDFS